MMPKQAQASVTLVSVTLEDNEMCEANALFS